MSMPVVDTHAHLADPAFAGDLDAVLDRAREAGVGAVIVVGEDEADAQRVLSLAERRPEVLPALGLYPGRVHPVPAERLLALIRERRAELAGIGEVGLDYWIAREPELQEVQRRVFARFVDLALELDLPLNVHSRSAGAETIRLLVERGARRVQMHAFDGKAASARRAVEAGYCFSVPPSIARSDQKRKLVRHLPLECLLLETDSPVLGPAPGERNEPANVLVSARAVAELKGVPIEEVLRVTTLTARRLYGAALERRLAGNRARNRTES